ncbi:MAG: hypothetical protein ACLGIK_10460, partial [Gemmatimonadota bacterium]
MTLPFASGVRRAALAVLALATLPARGDGQGAATRMRVAVTLPATIPGTIPAPAGGLDGRLIV